MDWLIPLDSFDFNSDSFAAVLELTAHWGEDCWWKMKISVCSSHKAKGKDLKISIYHIFCSTEDSHSGLDTSPLNSLNLANKVSFVACSISNYFFKWVVWI